MINEIKMNEFIGWMRGRAFFAPAIDISDSKVECGINRKFEVAVMFKKNSGKGSWQLVKKGPSCCSSWPTHNPNTIHDDKLSSESSQIIMNHKDWS